MPRALQYSDMKQCFNVFSLLNFFYFPYNALQKPII